MTKPQKIEGGWDLVDKILTACGLDVDTGFEVEKGSVYCLIQDEIKKAKAEVEESMTLKMVAHEKPFYDAGYEKGRASERQRCVEDGKESLYEGAYAFLRYYIQPMITGTSGANQTYKEMLKLLPQFKNKYVKDHAISQAKHNLEQLK